MWRRPALSGSARRRRGFTLLEVVLVAVLLLIVASLTVPAFQGPLAAQRLRQSAEELRASWTRARVDSMQSGAVFVFQCQYGTGHYQIQRWQGLGVDETNVSDTDASEFAPAVSAPQAIDMAAPGVRTLAKGVVFQLSQATDDARGELLQANAGAGPAAAGWSDPIFFYPDGTTSTAAVVVGDQRAKYIEVSARGLTGLIRVSRPMSEAAVVTGEASP
ncbi:MAG: prepilin-type N-terminal cleavage/methylation domain-containing protein [Planctomycetales bacterium]